ncbi:MAG TPA: methylated-DNA--[protein]-cysteine S-methyltransferase [Thermoplasmata archaeon]|nr:methylated-DNA--[protein]-cysteine S-methyltransferase [Thermoplasmata archaeon]
MGSELTVAHVPTPIGTFRVVYHDRQVRTVDLLERGHEEREVPPGATPLRGSPPPGSAVAQLKEYFAGRRSTFDFDLSAVPGSEFDRAIWAELCKVPAGRTVSYGELARKAGHPGAARAVGGSMHRNPLPVMIPCHRVVGDDRSLTGYGLGLWRKKWLLEHEGAWPLRSGTLYGPADPTQLTLDAATGPGARSRARKRSSVRSR